MTDKTFTEFTIHALDPAGITMPVYAGSTAITARSRILRFGESTVITADVYEQSKNRHGVSWLDATPEEQVAKHGKQRFGRGAVPEHVVQTVQAQRAAEIHDEIASLKYTNPRLSKASAATLRLRELEAELGVTE
jgi:hypothetical protein